MALTLIALYFRLLSFSALRKEKQLHSWGIENCGKPTFTDPALWFSGWANKYNN